MVSVELLALLGEVALSIAAAVTLPTGRSHDRHLEVSVASLIVWTYIATLAALRLLTSTTNWRLSFAHLWHHTAFLYGAQWFWQVWVFRSALIRSKAPLARHLTIGQFALTSLLLVIALTSRKGNRGVILEYEGDIDPSKEPLASPLSIATFSWVDPIIWIGWKRTLEMTDVWNVTLKDKAEHVLTQFRQVKKTHSLALRLLIHFQKQVLLQGAWCMLASVFMFLPTMLLKAILEYLEDQDNTPVTAAWLYVILLFVTGCIQAVGDGQALWIGRKVCIQLRAIIVGEIYSKTLRRKAAASTESDPEKPEDSVKKPLLKRVTTFFTQQRMKLEGKNVSKPVAAKKSDAPATNGTIINLMSIDSFKVAEICAYLHFLWAAVPVEVIMAVALLYNVLGFSSLAGIGLMCLGVTTKSLHCEVISEGAETDHGCY